MPPVTRPVIAYHLILTCYGFWLPNDPRGSNSTQVWAEALKPFGLATKTDHSRSVANVPHDRSARRAAKQILRHPPVRFDGHQALAVVEGFASHCRFASLPCFACCVMPDHAHMVVPRSAKAIERVAVDLKTESVHALLGAGLHPYQAAHGERPKIWARGSRHVFLFDDADIERSVDYVDNNPQKHGLRRQRWSFITPFRRECE